MIVVLRYPNKDSTSWFPSFKKDPTPILPILRQLKNDPSLHVRKSVANNLNDISKTHPALVITLAKEWYGKEEVIDWVVRHGCRTLLKQGNQEVLSLFGYLNTTIIIHDFSLAASTVRIGETLSFSFVVSVKKAAKIRVEYGIDYVKANGKQKRKIFQIAKLTLKDNQSKHYVKQHCFADVSIRTHYPGIHAIVLIINGVEQGKLDFQVIV